MYSDYHVFLRNKERPKTEYPSISQQDKASEIFEFISTVKSAPVNNGLFSFRYTTDITDILKIQIAGMIHTFLRGRKDLKNNQTIIDSIRDVKFIVMDIQNKINTDIDSDSLEITSVTINDISTEKLRIALCDYFSINEKSYSFDNFFDYEPNENLINFLLRKPLFYSADIPSYDDDGIIETINVGIAFNHGNPKPISSVINDLGSLYNLSQINNLKKGE